MAKERKGVVNEVMERPGTFAVAFLVFFALAYAFLSAAGATPDPVTTTENAPVATDIAAATSTPELPVRIVAQSVGLDASVSNPDSTDVDVLDQALLKGAVRYPTTAMLGQDGTTVIFGHSSYLPIVHNQAYKTFDGIQNLKTGDIVSVYSDSVEYRYSVVGVKVADATQDSVDLPSSGQHLTLVTCDSFASKSNRFVVTADFVGTYALGN